MQSRTKNAALNISSNFIVNIIKTIFTFVTRTVFIYVLGKEMLGLNGLFTNILTMLSLAELGVGTAISFSLYKPLSTNDNQKISALMTLYKKVYRIIGVVIILIGIALIPLLPLFIKNIESINNVYLIYILYLLNSSVIYFIAYKETLIIADQKKYKIMGIEGVSIILLNILQIVFLLLTKNFVAYLLIQLIVSTLQRIIINVYITKKYSNIDFNSKELLDSSDLTNIKRNVKAMVFHKVGDVCVNGTDNIVISSFINLAMVGVYSNYLIIINMLNTYTQMIFNNMISGLGNLIVNDKLEKRYTVFKRIDFLDFIIYGYCSTVLICVFNTFIKVWVGGNYCLPFSIVLLIVINFFITGRRVSASAMKQAAGLYVDDRFTPIIQSLVNLTISIVLAIKIGLTGVIIGTIVSGLILPCWQRPYLVYKSVLKKSFTEYCKKYICQVIQISISMVFSIALINYINITNTILLLFIEFVVATLIYLIVVLIFYSKSDEFRFYFDMLKGKLIKNEKRIS